MRGSSAPAHCGCALTARCSAVGYSHCGGMSGASVSSTMASAGSSAASRRICNAAQRSSRRQSRAQSQRSTNASACCRLPLKACAMPPTTRVRRSPARSWSLLRRTCRITGRPCLAASLRLRGTRRTTGARHPGRHKEVQPDLAHRHQQWVVGGGQHVVQQAQVLVRACGM